jgi:hypothetical protein
MMPDLMIDMTALLVPFAAGCAGFVAVVFVALLGAVISRRPRQVVGVDRGRAVPRRARRVTAAA